MLREMFTRPGKFAPALVNFNCEYRHITLCAIFSTKTIITNNYNIILTEEHSKKK